MKIPKFNIPDSKEKDAQIFLNLLTGAIGSKYDKGLDGQYRRIFARIQLKFDEAIEKDAHDIAFETAEIELMSNAFKDGRIPALFAKYVMLIEDTIEEDNKKPKK